MAHAPSARRDYWWGWGDLLFRWLHVVAAIAWIGVVVLLHRARQPPAAARRRARRASAASAARSGRSTAAASTGSRSSGSRRERLPEPLHWFKWEAYTTWLSGFALLVVVYFVARRDVPRRPDASRTSRRWEAIAIAVGGLVARVARLRRALPRCSATTSGVLAVAVFAFVALARLGRRRSSSRRARRTSRSARCSGRSWSRTSSS